MIQTPDFGNCSIEPTGLDFEVWDLDTMSPMLSRIDRPIDQVSLAYGAIGAA